MSAALQAVIFDLDDTLLVDEAETRRAMHQTARFFGVRQPENFVDTAISRAHEVWQCNPRLDWCRMLGHSALEGLWCDYSGDDDNLNALADWQPRYLREVWKYTCQNCGISELCAGSAARHFQTERDRLHPWMPGAKTLLRFLQRTDRRLAILTNGISKLQWRKMSRSGIAPHFPTIVVSGDFGRGKPDPEIFLHTLERLGVPAERCLMVGNNPASDILGAQRAGIPCCWLQNDGCPYPERQKTADFVVQELEELLRLPVFADTR